MTSAIIAQVLVEVYYAGRALANEQRLDYDDFLQMVYMATAKLLRDQLDKDDMMGTTLSVSELLNPYELVIKTDKFKRKIAALPPNVIHLQNNMGVFSLVPLAGDESTIPCKSIIRMPSGSEWLYCNANNEPFSYFTVYKDEIVFYGLEDCVKKVLAYIISTNEDSNVPDDLGWQVFVMVYNQTIGSWGTPLDKRMDGNPLPDDIFFTKLTSPEGNKER